MTKKSEIIKSKMVDLGKKSEISPCCTEYGPNKSEDKVYYPTMYISRSIPFLGKDSVGQKKKLIVEATIKGYSLNKGTKSSEDRESYDIEINKIGE